MKVLKIFKKSVFVSFFLISFLLIFNCLTTMAQESKYPEKTVQLICPYGPGGSTDIALRLWADIIRQYLGQPVVVINKPGASGAIAIRYIIEQVKPDGYILIGASGGCNTGLPARYLKLPFEWDALTFIARVQITPMMLVTRPDTPFKTVEDLFDFARSNPEKLTISGATPADATTMGPKYLFHLANIPYEKMSTVPHDGAAQALLTLLKGDADICFTVTSPLISQVKAGKLRGLLTTVPLPDLPDVPTSEQIGLPEFDFKTWQGLCGPPNLSDYVVKKWNEDIKKMMETPKFQKTVRSIGDIPGYLAPEEFKAFVGAEVKKRRGIFKMMGVLKEKM